MSQLVISSDIINKEELKELVLKGLYPISVTMNETHQYIYEVDSSGIWFGTKYCSEEKRQYLNKLLDINI